MTDAERTYRREYTPLDYIESGSGQWLDTGVTPTTSDTFTVEADLLLTTINTSDNNILFGSYSDENSLVRLFAFVDASSRPRIAYGGAASSSHKVSANTRYTFAGHFAPSSQYLAVNNATMSSMAGTPSYLPTVPMALFACRYNDTIISPSSMRLYSATTTLNGSLVRSFVPAKRKSDSVAGMFDLVGGVFYASASGTDFVAGNEVAHAPAPIMPTRFNPLGG